MDIDVIFFDVFGTVVDWRGSIIREGQDVWRERGVNINWEDFADRWREGYQPAMDRIRRGEDPWADIDTLHRRILDELLVDFGAGHLDESQRADLNRIWHRLLPWDDSVGGITQLREKYIVSSLSNGNMSLQVDLSRFGGIGWDCILSSELFHHYKPDLETYQGACDLLDVSPERALMVASHRGDLLASQQIGMRTAFVRRPREYGEGNIVEHPHPSFDIVAEDFFDLRQQIE